MALDKDKLLKSLGVQSEGSGKTPPAKEQAIPAPSGLTETQRGAAEALLNSPLPSPEPSAAEDAQFYAAKALTGLQRVGETFINPVRRAMGEEPIRGVEQTEAHIPITAQRKAALPVYDEEGFQPQNFNRYNIGGALIENIPFLATTYTLGGAFTKAFSPVLGRGVGAVAGAAVGEGLPVGAEAYENVYDTLREIPIKKIEGSEEYQAAYAATNPHMPEADRQEAAREALARETARVVAASIGASTAILGSPSAALVAKFMRGEIGESVLTSMLKQAFLEGVVQEAPQSMVEFSIEKGSIDALQNKESVSENVKRRFLSPESKNQGIIGGTVGTMIGSGMAGGQSVAAGQPFAPTFRTAIPTQEEAEATPSVEGQEAEAVLTGTFQFEPDTTYDLPQEPVQGAELPTTAPEEQIEEIDRLIGQQEQPADTTAGPSEPAAVAEPAAGGFVIFIRDDSRTGSRIGRAVGDGKVSLGGDPITPPDGAKVVAIGETPEDLLSYGESLAGPDSPLEPGQSGFILADLVERIQQRQRENEDPYQDALEEAAEQGTDPLAHPVVREHLAWGATVEALIGLQKGVVERANTPDEVVAERAVQWPEQYMGLEEAEGAATPITFAEYISQPVSEEERVKLDKKADRAEPDYQAAVREMAKQVAVVNDRYGKPSSTVPDASVDSAADFLTKTRAQGAETRGVNREQGVKDGAVDPASFTKGGVNTFTTKGMSFDTAAELLNEAGFPVPQEYGEAQWSPNSVSRMLKAEAHENRGVKGEYDPRSLTYTPQGTERIAELGAIEMAMAQIEGKVARAGERIEAGKAEAIEAEKKGGVPAVVEVFDAAMAEAGLGAPGDMSAMFEGIEDGPIPLTNEERVLMLYVERARQADEERMDAALEAYYEKGDGPALLAEAVAVLKAAEPAEEATDDTGDSSEETTETTAGGEAAGLGEPGDGLVEGETGGDEAAVQEPAEEGVGQEEVAEEPEEPPSEVIAEPEEKPKKKPKKATSEDESYEPNKTEQGRVWKALKDDFINSNGKVDGLGPFAIVETQIANGKGDDVALYDAMHRDFVRGLQERVEEERLESNYQFVNTVEPVLTSEDHFSVADNDFLSRQFYESLLRAWRRAANKAAKEQAQKDKEIDVKAGIEEALNSRLVPLSEQYIDGFTKGFWGAVEGKMRSALPAGLGVADGYTKGDIWLSGDGNKYAPKSRRRKKEDIAEGMGVQVERLMDQIDKPAEGTVEAELNRIYKTTTTPKVINPALASNATPGTERFVTSLRRGAIPFKTWVVDYKAKIDHDSDDKVAEVLQEWVERDEDKRLKQVREWAKEWITLLGEVGKELDGVGTIRGVAERLRKRVRAIEVSNYPSAGKTFYEVWLKDYPWWQDRSIDSMTERLEATGVPDGAPTPGRFARNIINARDSQYNQWRWAKPDDGVNWNDVNRLFKNKLQTFITPLEIRDAERFEHSVPFNPDDLRVRSPIVAHRHGPFMEEWRELDEDGLLKNATPEDYNVFQFGKYTDEDGKEKYSLSLGKWTGQKGVRMREHMNMTHDAFRDLAKMLGVDPKAISFNGKLHMAIGKLGLGGRLRASAFFVRPAGGGTDFTHGNVINLINKAGDGSLGHEWMHAFDDNVGGSGRAAVEKVKALLAHRVNDDVDKWINDVVEGVHGKIEIGRDGKLRYGSSYRAWRDEEGKTHYAGWGQRPKEDRRKGLREALTAAKATLAKDAEQFFEYEALLEETNYLRSAKAIDGLKPSAKPYWATPAEMFARAGETFIHETLKEKGGSNNYLVHDYVEGAKASDAHGFVHAPFPQGDERTAMVKAYQSMFDAVEWTDEGAIIPAGWKPPGQGDAAAKYKEKIDDWLANMDSYLDAIENELLADAQKALDEQEAAEREAAEKKRALWEAGKDKEEDPINKSIEDMTESDILDILEEAEKQFAAAEEGVDESADVTGEQGGAEGAERTGSGDTTGAGPGINAGEDGAGPESGGGRGMGASAGSGDAGAGGRGRSGGAGQGASSGEPAGAGRKKAAAGKSGKGAAGESKRGAGRKGKRVRDEYGVDLKSGLSELGIDASEEMADDFGELFDLVSNIDVPGGSGTAMGAVELPGHLEELYEKMRPVMARIFKQIVSQEVSDGDAIIALHKQVRQATGRDITLVLARFMLEYKNGTIDELMAERGSSKRRSIERKAKAADVQVVLTDPPEAAIYDPYSPPASVMDQFPGWQEHPTPLVESAVMASTELPPAKYVASPFKVKGQWVKKGDKYVYKKGAFDPVATGDLSGAQLHQVVYFGNATENMLGSGGDTVRQGYFVGDGTGVGKGRTIAAFILDHMRKGRGNGKAVWISKNLDLVPDARGDIAGIGGDPNLVHALNEAGPKARLFSKNEDGIIFVGYTTLGMDALCFKEKDRPKGPAAEFPRVQQIIDTVGKDFDGVIAFDESHIMGTTDLSEDKNASKIFTATRMLREQLPNARVAYVSATGASKLVNLAYLDRLGLWGPDMPHGTAGEFVQAMKTGGTAAMESVAKDMKAMGLYMARSIGFDGIQYGYLTHTMTDEDRKDHHNYADIWLDTRKELKKALNTLRVQWVMNPEKQSESLGNKRKNDLAKMVRGAALRFFDGTLSATVTPDVIADIERKIGFNPDTGELSADGESAVIQLEQTYEALKSRIRERLNIGPSDPIPDDEVVSPTEVLREFIQMWFPTHPFHAVRAWSPAAKKEIWKAVENKDAPENEELKAIKRSLLERVDSAYQYDNPIDMIVRHFGRDNVSVITGAVSNSQREEEANLFLDDERRILIFSRAGGTGKSYHADLRRKNQRLRHHYVLQPGWSAESAVQGMGRTHRSGQREAPVYYLVTTNMQAQKRFVSTIAKRLGELGALTKGQRQTGGGSGDLFSDDINITTKPYSGDALRATYEKIVEGGGIDYKDEDGNAKRVTANSFEDWSGVGLTTDAGNLMAPDKLPPLEKLLNYLLGMPVNMGNAVFDHFYEVYSKKINDAKDNGSFNPGVELVAGDLLEKQEDRVVQNTNGALTRYVRITAKFKAVPPTFDEFQQMVFARGTPEKVTFATNKSTGRIHAYVAWAKSDYTQMVEFTPWPSAITDRKIVAMKENSNSGVYIRTPSHDYPRTVKYIGGTESGGIGAEKSFAMARRLWTEQRNNLLEEDGGFWTRQQHLITGATLPIWDRLPESGSIKVRRAIIPPQNEGEIPEVIIGRLISDRYLEETLRKLEATGLTIEPARLLELLDSGVIIELSNGDVIEKLTFDYTSKEGYYKTGTDFVIRTADRKRYTPYGAVWGQDYLGRDGDIKEAGIFAGKQNVAIEEKGAAKTIEAIVNRYPVAGLKDQEGDLVDESGKKEGEEPEDGEGDLFTGGSKQPTGGDDAPLKAARLLVKDAPSWMVSKLGADGTYYMIKGDTIKHKDELKSVAPNATFWGNQTAWIINETDWPAVVDALGDKIRLKGTFNPTGDSDAAFSAGPMVPDPMPQAKVEASLTRLRREAPTGGLPIRSVKSAMELSPRLQKAREERGIIPAGVYDAVNGEVIIVASNILNQSHLERVVSHELFGHYATRRLLGRGFNPYLNDVWRKYKNDPRMKAILEEYNFDPTVSLDRRKAADELIAKMAEEIGDIETEKGKDVNTLKRIIRAIRRLVRNIPVIGRYIVNLNDNDIKQMLVKAKLNLTRADLERGIMDNPAQHVAFAVSPRTVTYGMRGDDIMAAVVPNPDGTATIYWGKEGKKLTETNFRKEEVQNDAIGYRKVESAGLAMRGRRQNYGARQTTAELFRNLTLPEERLPDHFLRRIQDKMRRLLVIQRAVKEQGGTLDTETDAYLADERLPGLTFERVRAFEEAYVEPIIDTLRENQISLEEADQFLYARHAEERNKVMEQRNEALAQEAAAEGLQLSGMTDVEAAQILSEVQAGGKAAAYKKLGQLVDRMTRHHLDVMESEGLERQDTADLLRKQYKHYVPLQGFADESDERAAEQGRDMMAVGRGVSVPGREWKLAAGRVTRAADILTTAIGNAERTLARAERNKVGKAFLKFVQANPDKNLWEVNKYNPKARMGKDGEIEYTHSRQLADNEIVVKVAGKDVRVTIHDPLLFRAMANLGTERMGVVVRSIGRVTRLLAQLNTSWNIEFAPVNLIRDFQTAVINATDEGLLSRYNLTEAQRAALDDPKVVRKILKNTAPALSGAMRALRGATSADESLSEGARSWVRAFEQYRESGGKVEFYSMQTLEGRRKSIERQLRNAQGGFGAGAYKGAQETFKLVSDLNSAMENATRLAAFKALIDANVPAPVAGSIARNLTVNFNRKGELGTVASSLWMFFNAGVQGNARMLQAMTRSKRVQKVAAGLVLAHALINAMTRVMMGYDDDDDQWYYDKIPDWVKDHNLIVPAFWSDTPGRYAKVPLPYGYNVLAVLGNIVGDIAAGQTKASEVPGEALRFFVSVADAFNPMGDTHSVMQLVSPTITDPFVQLYGNENFYGAPIRPEPPTWAKHEVPDSQLYWSSVSPANRMLAERMNRLTGGSKYRPGLIDISPETLDHLMAFVGGGTGATFLRSISSTHRLALGEDVPTREVPLARRVLGDTPEYVAATDYRERIAEVEAVRREVEDARASGNGETVRTLVQDQGALLKLVTPMKATEKELRKLFKLRRQVQQSKLPRKVKKKRLDDLNASIEKLQKRFIRRYNEVTQ